MGGCGVQVRLVGGLLKEALAVPRDEHAVVDAPQHILCVHVEIHLSTILYQGSHVKITSQPHVTRVAREIN